MARGLLQRIERVARSQGSGSAGNAQISILEHVQALLNTRQGSSRLDPSYGIPDVTDVLHSLPGGMTVLRTMIEECIRKHEPRLSEVRVTALAKDEEAALHLRFKVHAVLATGASICFETEVSRGGRVRVR